MSAFGCCLSAIVEPKVEACGAVSQKLLPDHDGIRMLVYRE